MNEKYLESAMLFARLYGIAETLNPWSYIDNEKFTCILICPIHDTPKSRKVYLTSLS